MIGFRILPFHLAVAIPSVIGKYKSHVLSFNTNCPNSTSSHKEIGKQLIRFDNAPIKLRIAISSTFGLGKVKLRCPTNGIQ